MKNDIFSLMTSVAKTKIKADRKTLPGLEESFPIFFSEFFLVIILLEIKAIVCEEKIASFSKFDAKKIASFSKFELW